MIEHEGHPRAGVLVTKLKIIPLPFHESIMGQTSPSEVLACN